MLKTAKIIISGQWIFKNVMNQTLRQVAAVIYPFSTKSSKDGEVVGFTKLDLTKTPILISIQTFSKYGTRSICIEDKAFYF